MISVMTSTEEQAIRRQLALMKFCADSVNLAMTIEHYELMLAEIDQLRKRLKGVDELCQPINSKSVI